MRSGGHFDSAVTTLTLAAHIDSFNAYCFLAAGQVVCIGAGEPADGIGILGFKHYFSMRKAISCKNSVCINVSESLLQSLSKLIGNGSIRKYKDIVYVPDSGTAETLHRRITVLSTLSSATNWQCSICRLYVDGLIVIQKCKAKRWRIGSNELKFHISLSN
jgi:hypothetical protein